MNDHSRRRFSLAELIAPAYASNPKVRTVFVAGSVARDLADEHSDLEINVLWSEPPTDEDRTNAIQQLQGQVVRFLEFEDNEWSEVYTYQGIKIEMSHFLFDTVAVFTDDVVKRIDPDLDKQILTSSIQRGIPLYGQDVLDDLKSRVAHYPDELVEVMVEQHAEFDPAWYYAALAEREDVIMLYDVMNQVIFRMMSVLSGLNRQYISHPRFKWASQTIASFTNAPANMMERLTRIYQLQPVDGLRELQELAKEVLQLVETRPTKKG